MPGISPARAATIAGSAYRDGLDRELRKALAKIYWSPGRDMVVCDTLNAAGTKRFSVRVCYWSGWNSPPPYATSRELMVHYDHSPEHWLGSDEEIFDEIGKKLAKAANAAMEELYMGVPDER